MRLSAPPAQAATAGRSIARRQKAPAALGQRRQWCGRRRQVQAQAAATQTQQPALEQQLIEELEAALPGAADEAMPVASTQQAAAVRGGALSLVAPGGQEREVPSTLPGALAAFFSHPSAVLILCALAGLACWRAQLPVHPAADAAVAGAVAAGWCVQVGGPLGGQGDQSCLES